MYVHILIYLRIYYLYYLATYKLAKSDLCKSELSCLGVTRPPLQVNAPSKPTQKYTRFNLILSLICIIENDDKKKQVR